MYLFSAGRAVIMVRSQVGESVRQLQLVQIAAVPNNSECARSPFPTRGQATLHVIGSKQATPSHSQTLTGSHLFASQVSFKFKLKILLSYF